VLPLLILVALILAPPLSNGCGPFLPSAQFRYTLGPPDTAAYNAGTLGIVHPSYYRRNLIVAYRYFTAAPLSKEESQSLTPSQPVVAPPDQQAAKFSYDTQDGARLWLVARNAVAGTQPLTSLPADRQAPGDQYQRYGNCLDDAFRSAASTLKQRMAKWHAGSPELTEWIKGQDFVFQNCSEGAHIPAPVAAGSDLLLVADRQYQIAAAEFYAEKFDDAQRDFQAIAGNAASPWKDSAPYLVARTLIRKATLGSDATALKAAQDRLQAILNDPARKAWHDRARSLSNLVRSRMDPEGRMAELGADLTKPGPGPKFAQDVTDFTALWDKLGHGPADKSDLADWIDSFQNNREDGKHAVERWRQTKSDAWLIAALGSTPPSSDAAAALIAAARDLKPANPAYATATYLALALRIATSPDDKARDWAAEASAAKQPDDAHNGFLAERLQLARNWADFLRYAPRKPVAVTTDSQDGELENTQTALGPLLDEDAAQPMNRLVPLSRWVEAVKDPLLPKNLQADVAQAGWVRAVVLDRTEEARQFAGRLAELRPELADGLRPYLAENDPAAAKFAAIFLMLRDPGFDIRVRAGFPRETKTDAIDDYRDNWWHLVQKADAAEKQPNLPKEFLSPDERAAGEKEAQALVASASAAPNYLAAQAIDWARKHPEDSRVPEALHLAVRATRFGITDAQTTGFSKAAFQLLHQRYANSKWAALTKYWY
jgi:hypothetical protein